MFRIHRIGPAVAALVAGLFIAAPAAAQVGACCLPNGVCDELTETDCVDAGGIWSGPLPCAVLLEPLGISGIQSWDLIGDPDNTIFIWDLAASIGLPSGTAVRILSVGYDLDINAVCPSWLADTRIRFGEVTINPASGDSFCGIGSYSGTIVHEFIAPTGYVVLEAYETFDDFPDAVDAVYMAGSTISVTVALGCPPAVHNVTQDEYYPTIQQAIFGAADGDLIEATSRVYHETPDFVGKDVKLRPAPGGTTAPIIDGGGDAPVVTFTNAQLGTEIEGFAITGGNDAGASGGGILVDGAPGRVNIRDCYIHGNSAALGGGIALLDGAAPLIDDCVLIANAASGNGGGIYVGAGCDPQVFATRLQGHTAASGGAIWVGSAASPTFDRIDATFNASTTDGSVLKAHGSGLVTLTNSLLWMNTGNGASGAAVTSLFGSSMDVAHCTIVANSGNTHGGLYGGFIDVNSCIVWNNSPQQIQPATSTSVSFSDVMGGWGGAGTDNIDADPMFVLEPGGDLHLTLPSPCINRGDNGSPYACPLGCVPPSYPPRCVDLDGDTRLRTCRVDMGAYETPFFRDCNDNGLSDACDVSPVFGFMCTILGDLDFHLAGNATFGVLITSVTITGPSDSGPGPTFSWGEIPLFVDGGTFEFDASYTCTDTVCPGGSYDYPVFFLDGTFYGLNDDGTLGPPTDGSCTGAGTYHNGNQVGVVHYTVNLEALAGPGPYLVGVGVASVDNVGGPGIVNFQGFYATHDGNGNGVPDECDCPGDSNGDGDVDVNDLNNVILDWGTDGSAHGGDITGPIPGSPPDGIVNVNDLNAVIVNWGLCTV